MSCFLEAAQVSRECFKYVKVLKIPQDKLSLQEKRSRWCEGPEEEVISSKIGGVGIRKV